MPTSTLGLVLFVMLLFPGYVYERRRAMDVSDRVRSPFRETVAVVFIGVITSFVVLVAFVCVSELGPSWFPDPVEAVGGPGAYWRSHPLRSIALLAFGVVSSCLLAHVVAARPWRTLIARVWPGRASSLHLRDPQQSAWWLLFRAKPGHQVYVGCYLDNGAYVCGLLHSFNRSESETTDRELTLRTGTDHPLLFRPGPDALPQPLTHVGTLAVSARHIVVLTVTYLRPSSSVPPSTPASEPGAADPR